MMKRRLLELMFVLLVCSCSLAVAQSTPSDVVRKALSYDQLHDTVFNRENIDLRRKWMTHSLYRLFATELIREEREAKERPEDKPYFGDWAGFSAPSELCKVGEVIYPLRFSLSKTRFVGGLAYVRARFFYHFDCDHGQHRFYTFILRKVRSTWRIDNIDYGSNSTLRRVLRRKDS